MLDLDSLNPAQRAAATAGSGAHLVIAGAGSGKTRVLVHRVAWLISQGTPPGGIVLLTFTRRAAAEMLGRVARMVGPAARQVRGGTFHSFALQALREHAPAVGLQRDFTVLDSSDAEDLVGLVRAELGLGGRGKRFPQKGTLATMFSRQRNTSRALEQVLDELYPQYLDDLEGITAVGEAFAERKRSRNLVDFDDLLGLLDQLLKSDPIARAALSRSAQQVLVDEYQDTNRIQARIAALLSYQHGNIMAVGDEAQSIYGFRGAEVENILRFQQVFPKGQVHLLEQSYRSSPQILGLANGILGSAAHGYGKKLWSALPPGPLPHLVDTIDEADEAAFVVREILALREEGLPLREIAVLFRGGHHSVQLELELARANLPFKKYGGLRFTEAAHVKDLFALLRLVANPQDELAWFRILRWFNGVGEKTARRLTEVVLGRDPPRLEEVDGGAKAYGPDLQELSLLLDRAQALADDLPALVDLLLGWFSPRLDGLYEDAKIRRRDLEALPAIAPRYADLESFLAEIALDPPTSAEAAPADTEEEQLVLSTVHSAKGLEWSAVFILQLTDGAFPSGYALREPEGVEEERRLFYVACTRARRRLWLSSPRFRRGGSFAFSPGCTLLEEIEGLAGMVQELSPDAPAPTEAQSATEAEAQERLDHLLHLLGG